MTDQEESHGQEHWEIYSSRIQRSPWACLRKGTFYVKTGARFHTHSPSYIHLSARKSLFPLSVNNNPKVPLTFNLNRVHQTNLLVTMQVFRNIFSIIIEQPLDNIRTRKYTCTAATLRDWWDTCWTNILWAVPFSKKERKKTRCMLIFWDTCNLDTSHLTMRCD